MTEIEILEKLVSFDTIEDKENSKILDFIQEFLENLGFKVEERKKYLCMSYGDNPRFGFVGHSDTVEFIDGWDTNPHILTQKGDMLYGLGSADMKGGIAAILYTVSQMDLEKLNYGIRICITYDEEIGFGGITDALEDGMVVPEYTVIGEPTDNVAMIGCKGLFAIKFKTNGIKVHSSTPNRGKSANTSMIKLLSELEEFYNENIRNEIVDVYDIPYTTMNIGLINGGSAINSVAAECSSYVDFRTTKEEHHELLLEKIQELVQKYDGSYEVDVDIKPFFNDVDFIEGNNTAGFMTEASFLDSKRIILGVGPMTAHEVNEHISVDSLRQCCNQYEEIITKVCM